MTGLHLSHYAIDAELGRGGMGIVYRARDTKLDRIVALKVLPASALASPDDRARFRREAQSAAAITHPNVCHIYQVDEAQPLTPEGKPVEGHMEPRLFIAMEYIDGETLHDYVKKGPVKLQEAINIAGQIAEALKEAHAKDIVHRDIKSANIMLTEGGVAKVLDFGLAKTNQSTMLTRMGSTLGTVAYMSPEQARGQEVDGRSDLYSLGTVLYEMVAGRLPYSGDYEQAVLYGILNEAPEPLTALRTGVPMQLEWVVNKLLAKEAEYRYQSAAGLLADLKSLDLGGSGRTQRMAAAPVSAGEASTGRSQVPIWVWGAIAGALLLGAAVAWLLKPGASSPTNTVTRFAVNLPFQAQSLLADWSQDGRTLFYIAQDSSGAVPYIRNYHLNTGDSRPIAGTDFVEDLFVSPDGRWLVFFDTQTDIFKRMPLTGGEPTRISGSESPWSSGAFAHDGSLLFASAGFGIDRVSPSGERSTIASNDTLGGELFFQPQPLPNGDLLWASWDNPTTLSGTWMLKNGDSEPTKILPQLALQALGTNGYGLFYPAGPIGDPLAIAPIDLGTGRLLGVPVPFERAEPFSAAISDDGNLIYQESRLGGLTGETEILYLVDEAGTTTRLGSVPGVSNDFATANNRRAVVLESRDQGDTRRDLYLYDIDVGTTTRLTRSGHNENPDWSPDGEYIYFDTADDQGRQSIARRRADGSGDIEEVFNPEQPAGNPTISPDGSVMVFTMFDEESAWDLYQLDLESGDGTVISNAEGSQSDAHFSPDGRYVVFRSGGEIGALVVTPIQGEGEVELTDVGGYPVWSADGRYIYYKRSLTETARIEVSTEPVFTKVGSEEIVHVSPTHSHFDLLGDGTLVISQPGSNVVADRALTWVVLNFQDEMERLAPIDN